MKKVLNDLPFYVSEPIKQQLSKAKDCVLDDSLEEDRIYIITGREGTGKSKLAKQLAFHCDPTLSLDRVVFSGEDFKRVVRSASIGQAVIFDEAFNGLSSKGAISKENKKLITLLQECRQRRLFIFIVLPSFFLLEKYVAIFRSQALFNVLKSKRNPKRRWYKVYNYSKKKLLYIWGKNLMDYSRPKVLKKHNFYAQEPPTINEAEYKEKKRIAFQHKEKVIEKKDKFKEQRDILIRFMVKRLNLTHQKVSEALEEGGEPLVRVQITRILGDVP